MRKRVKEEGRFKSGIDNRNERTNEWKKERRREYVYIICLRGGEKEKGEKGSHQCFCAPISHSHRFPINLFFLKTNLFKGDFK